MAACRDCAHRRKISAPEFLMALEQLGPFGNGNAEPVFVSSGVTLVTALKVIKDRHLRLAVEDFAGGARFGGMAWTRRTDWAAMARGEGWGQGDQLDLAYRLRRNWHQDFGGWELDVVGIRSAKSPPSDSGAGSDGCKSFDS